MVIKCLYEIKNGNLACGTEEGDIFIFKIERRDFKKINAITVKEEIFKIGDFFDNMIYVLTKNFIKIYDETFTKEVLSFNNNKTFINLCILSRTGFALIKEGILYLNEFTNNEIEMSKGKENIIKIMGFPNTLIKANNYLIIGDIKQIHFLDMNKNFKPESKEISDISYEEIVFILKIHDKLLLASTNIGAILQITIKEKGNKEIIKS